MPMYFYNIEKNRVYSVLVFVNLFSSKSRDLRTSGWKCIKHKFRHLADFMNFFLSQQIFFVNCPGLKRKFGEKNSSKSSRPVVSTWPPRNSNSSDGIFPSKWTISDHSFPNYKKHFDNFSILPSFVPDKLRRPRILGPARSNLTLVPEEEEEDVELEGDHESSAHSSSPSSVVGPVAYLSCEVVSLGKATQVRIIKL